MHKFRIECECEHNDGGAIKRTNSPISLAKYFEFYRYHSTSNFVSFTWCFFYSNEFLLCLNTIFMQHQFFSDFQVSNRCLTSCYSYNTNPLWLLNNWCFCKVIQQLYHFVQSILILKINIYRCQRIIFDEENRFQMRIQTAKTSFDEQMLHCNATFLPMTHGTTHNHTNTQYIHIVLCNVYMFWFTL